MNVRPHWIEPTDEYPITLRRCQALEPGCPNRPTVFCLCGCERQLCVDCAEHEFLERQVRMAMNVRRHRADPINVRAVRSHQLPEGWRPGALEMLR